MEIVTAIIEHSNEIYELICELENEFLDKEEFLQIFQSNLNNKNIYYLVALEESSIIGFASLHIQKLLHHCARIGEIQELIVSKARQGSGVGTELFIHIKEIADKNNCEILEVCCNRRREKSHQFYLKQGMEQSHFKFTYNL